MKKKVQDFCLMVSRVVMNVEALPMIVCVWSLFSTAPPVRKGVLFEETTKLHFRFGV